MYMLWTCGLRAFDCEIRWFISCNLHTKKSGRTHYFQGHDTPLRSTSYCIICGALYTHKYLHIYIYVLRWWDNDGRRYPDCRERSLWMLLYVNTHRRHLSLHVFECTLYTPNAVCAELKMHYIQIFETNKYVALWIFGIFYSYIGEVVHRGWFFYQRHSQSTVD